MRPSDFSQALRKIASQIEKQPDRIRAISSLMHLVSTVMNTEQVECSKCGAKPKAPHTNNCPYAKMIEQQKKWTILK